MQTAARLFTSATIACATALQEPSICLIECETAFGLLIAHSSTDSRESLVLEQVSYLRVQGSGYRYHDLRAVVLKKRSGVWAAQDVTTKKYLPEPSKVSYSVLYLTTEQHGLVEQWHAANQVEAVFKYCQPRFGALPGFGYKSNLLETPDGYAVSGAAFPGEFLVPRAVA